MNKLFNISADVPPGTEPGSSGAPQVPVFTSGQAVVTFPVASALISVVYQVLGKVFPSWGTMPYVPFVLGLLAGTAIYFQSASKATTFGGRAAEVFFTLLNSVTLAAAALGITKVAS